MDTMIYIIDGEEFLNKNNKYDNNVDCVFDTNGIELYNSENSKNSKNIIIKNIIKLFLCNDYKFNIIEKSKILSNIFNKDIIENISLMKSRKPTDILKNKNFYSDFVFLNYFIDIFGNNIKFNLEACCIFINNHKNINTDISKNIEYIKSIFNIKLSNDKLLQEYIDKNDVKGGYKKYHIILSKYKK